MWGCGMPMGMFSMPFFLILAIACMFFFFRRSFDNGRHKEGNAELAEEVRRLRKEVEELRKENAKS